MSKTLFYIPKAPLKILITGFGPFPGMPENISARYAEQTVSHFYEHFAQSSDVKRKHHVFSHTFPCEWDGLREDCLVLLEKTKPHISLHFGVSEKAKSFVIEERCYNRTDGLEDAKKFRGTPQPLIPTAPERLITPFPTRDLQQHLRSKNLPCDISWDPGRYFCNYLYYHSLFKALKDAQKPKRQLMRLSLFIHIPDKDKDFLIDGMCEIILYAIRAYPIVKARIRQAAYGRRLQ